jgi:hypothetical protein
MFRYVCEKCAAVEMRHGDPKHVGPNARKCKKCKGPLKYDPPNNLTTKGLRRRVFIHAMTHCIFVMYADRRKYQHRSPAQFDARVKTVEEVRQWILDQPERFELIEPPAAVRFIRPELMPEIARRAAELEPLAQECLNKAEKQ